MYRSLSLDSGLVYQYQSTTFTDIMLKSTYYSRIKCSMLFGTYYAQNYASIIRPGLVEGLEYFYHVSDVEGREGREDLIERRRIVAVPTPVVA